ncbi:phage tail protein [Escherichia coli]|nr:phage tail protein [Escherichia coli]
MRWQLVRQRRAAMLPGVFCSPRSGSAKRCPAFRR